MSTDPTLAGDPVRLSLDFLGRLVSSSGMGKALPGVDDEAGFNRQGRLLVGN
jgi:hypothetical protein